MRFKTVVFVVSLLLIAGIAQADRLSLSTSEGPRSFDTVVLQDTFDRLSFDLSLQGIEVTPVTSALGTFVEFQLDDKAYTAVVGAPKIPVIRRLVRIPEGARVDLRVSGIPEKVSLSALTGLDEIIPVQPPIEKIPGAMKAARFAYDASAYDKNIWTFDKPAQVLETGHFRGIRVALIELRPINYNPAAGEITIIRNMSVRLRFEGGDAVATEEMRTRYSDPRISTMVQLFSFDGTGGDEKYDPVSSPSTYLIIGNETLFNVAEFQEFVEWKTQKGYDVVFLSTVEAGTSADAIRATIINAYNTWDRPPAYVLLLGDTDSVPYFISMTSDWPATDINYQWMDDADVFPDLGIGRFPARTSDQLVNMIRKTMANESMDFNSEDWIKKATFMASQDNSYITEATHNWVTDRYLTAADYIITKLYNGDGATTQQALDSINASLSLLTYSGHGDITYWADGPVVDQDQVRSLANDYYPMVFSFACLTGRYQEDEAFVETWLRASNGALAMLASSVTSYWTEDDILEKAIYWGLFQGDDNARLMTWIGGMIDFGKIGFYNYFSGEGSSIRYLQMYNLFGDPEQMVITESPEEANVSMDEDIGADTTSIHFSVSNAPFAMVGLSKNGQFLGVGYASDSGQGNAEIVGDLSDGDQILVTVTGHNIIPTFKTLVVGGGWHGDDDTAGGDDDTTPDSSDDDDDDDDDDGGCGG